MKQTNRRNAPLNRNQFYSEIANEVQKHDLQKIKEYMKKTYKTDKFDRLDLNELEALLRWLKELA